MIRVHAAPGKGARARRRPARRVPGLYYSRGFLSRPDREEILQWLSTIRPIWELRFSERRPLPEGEVQRRLLRPVYWLGNWQFACLNYYHPPKGVLHRCVRAEPFPPVLARIVRRVEAMAPKIFLPSEIPPRWRLNTCLVNFYGSAVGPDGKRVDTARVGDHKDFEPGPVASLSLGERALFQFVTGTGQVREEQWLDDGSLQIFGGPRWKSQLFHRVQRVDTRAGAAFPVRLPEKAPLADPPRVEFETRRLNFTFRYVPEEHITRFRDLPAAAREDVRGYMEELARESGFFRAELRG
jgi:DNA oxidative demethylase